MVQLHATKALKVNVVHFYGCFSRTSRTHVAPSGIRAPDVLATFRLDLEVWTENLKVIKKLASCGPMTLSLDPIRLPVK